MMAHNYKLTGKLGTGKLVETTHAHLATCYSRELEEKKAAVSCCCLHSASLIGELDQHCVCL